MWLHREIYVDIYKKSVLQRHDGVYKEKVLLVKLILNFKSTKPK